jgi:hypothetical protein
MIDQSNNFKISLSTIRRVIELKLNFALKIFRFMPPTDNKHSYVPHVLNVSHWHLKNSLLAFNCSPISMTWNFVLYKVPKIIRMFKILIGLFFGSTFPSKIPAKLDFCREYSYKQDMKCYLIQIPKIWRSTIYQTIFF